MQGLTPLRHGRRRRPEHVSLRDGSAVLVRPISRDDKQLLLDGFERLSPESRYRRFLVPMPHLSPSLVKYLTEVDHHDHEALVALSERGDGVGLARYVRLADEPNVAEVAVAVADDWHGRGVATELLHRLGERAREEGIERFSATCLAGNRDALGLFEGFAPTTFRRTEAGLVEADVRLPVETGDAAPLRDALREAATRRLAFRSPSG